MMRIQKTIERQIAVISTPRVKQMAGMFDLPPAKHSSQRWEIQFELPDDWRIGVIVGPSGCGKSTIARELFGDAMASDWPWPSDRSILDAFPAGMSIKRITALLSSVGFSSPPAWLRPFGVLSNGQQFRVNLARTLAELPKLAVVDEFSSVVDRTVAKIGSAAVAKTIRRDAPNESPRQFIAVTCHYDVIDWLEPDWIYEPHTGSFQTAAGGRGSLRRPAIELQIVAVDRSAWRLFRGHHYLSGDIANASRCFVGLIDQQPAAFVAILSFPHPHRPGWREHRCVCLPDFQGVGIGNAMSEFVASLYRATGKPYFSTTSHPSMIAHRSRSPLWRIRRKPALANRRGSNSDGCGMAATTAIDRLTAGFEFVGPANFEHARSFGIIR